MMTKKITDFRESKKITIEKIEEVSNILKILILSIRNLAGSKAKNEEAEGERAWVQNLTSAHSSTHRISRNKHLVALTFR